MNTEGGKGPLPFASGFQEEVIHNDCESFQSSEEKSYIPNIQIPSIYSQPVQSSVESVDSQSTLTFPQGNTELLKTPPNVPPALLRKKSGELVKSSLKLSSLGRSMSTSNLPTGKSVRFASRLANVKMFDGTESPSVVSTADNTPLHSPEYKDDYFGSNGYFDWKWGDGEVSDLTSDDTSSDDDVVFAGPQKLKYDIDYTDIPSIKSYERANSNCYLQSVKLSADKVALTGLLMVKNLAFEKHISIKVTNNGWCSSFYINNASYLKSFEAMGFDQFRFSLPLVSMPRFLKLEMVLRYDVNGTTYWDNNNNRNYHINLKPFVDITNDSPTIVNYNYDFKSSTAGFEDLINKLSNFEYGNDVDTKTDKKKVATTLSKPISKSEPKIKSEFHNRYNINDELVKPRSYPPIYESVPQALSNTNRPPLKTSFSSSDILSVKTPRYSQSHKLKQKNLVDPPNSVNGTQFNSKSYSDLLQSYCFYNGQDNTLGAQNEKSKSLPSLEDSTIHIKSPASTFNSFGDYIHI